MGKKRNTTLILTVCTTLLVFGFIGWFLVAIFEGEKPKVKLGPVPVFLTKTVEVPLVVTDEKRGVRTIKVTLKQGSRHITLLENAFPLRVCSMRKAFTNSKPSFPLILRNSTRGGPILRYTPGIIPEAAAETAI
jgi:hypothetical protein